VARLAPLEPLAPRRLGLLKGKIRIGEDFDAPLPGDLLDLFEGKGDPKPRPKPTREARKR